MLICFSRKLGAKLYSSNIKYNFMFKLVLVYLGVTRYIRNVIKLMKFYVRIFVNIFMIAFKLIYKLVSYFMNIFFFIKYGYTKNVVIILNFEIKVYP